MQVVLASESQAQREAARRTVLGVGLRCESVDCVDHTGLPLRLARGNADLVLLGLQTNLEAGLEAIQKVRQSSERPILAFGPPGEAAWVVEVLRAGASEYLDEWNLQEGLVATLERMRKTGVVENRQGRIVGVVSATAGSGVTTLSSGLACALAQQNAAGPVLLAEVGTGVPELALHLNLQPTYTLKQLLGEWERVDATLFRQTLVPHAIGVQILCAGTTGLTPPQVSDATMRQLLVLARNLFRRSVLDLGHGLTEGTLAAIQHADEVMVVTRLEIPALQLTRRLLRQLTQQYDVPPARLQIVGNRGNQRRQLSRVQVEEFLGTQLASIVPDETATAVLAQNEGCPLQDVAPRGRLCRSLTEMATRWQKKTAGGTTR